MINTKISPLISLNSSLFFVLPFPFPFSLCIGPQKITLLLQIGQALLLTTQILIQFRWK